MSKSSRSKVIIHLVKLETINLHAYIKEKKIFIYIRIYSATFIQTITQLEQSD